MQQRDHHDWTSDVYVDEWVRRQQTEDPSRAERFQLICDLFPFPNDATVTILDVGAGYGPVTQFILDRYPNATGIAQDGSEPMLRQAQSRLTGYGERFKVHQSDLFDPHWLPKPFGPFAAAVSSSCLHNLRDFQRISEIYRDIREQLQPGGVFLNLDLVNAPTPELLKRYGTVSDARRQREGVTRVDIQAMMRHGDSSPTHASNGPFPASLDQHLAALKAAGFREVDCFWKDLRRALFGGYT
jgi:tRNA (cmo5U34)-methyltransferase